MHIWTNHPFLRIILAFAFGILAARLGVAISQSTLVYTLAFLFLIVFVAKIFFRSNSNTFLANLLLVSIFLIGIYHYKHSDSSDQRLQLQTTWGACQAYIGTITSFPVEKGKYTIHQVDLSLGIQDSTFLNMPTRILLYEKKEQGQVSILAYGDKIQVEGHPFLISEAKNPYAFDYSKYMTDQHIYLHHFVESEEISLLSKHEANALLSSIYRIRSHFENIIKSNVKSKDEQGIVLALLLGIKGQLDGEIKTAYAAAGAMHVLAVSGLHVSIIYFVLNWLFRGIPPGNFKRFIAPTISILALWLYALLTGFSPSILRAVTMFSVIIFSKLLDRKSQVFNSLAFAAFVLLLFDPSFLFNIGFQLSFLAVAGIVYMYPKLYQLWDIQNPVGDYFWKLTCVSLAAQISTFPLSLYYFHQFPSYFLLANVVVIPVAFGIMILGICVLAFGSFTLWIGWLLEKMVSFMNWFVAFILHLDGSVIEWIFISGTQACLIYAVIMTFLALLKFKRFSYIWFISLAIICFSFDRFWNVMKQSNFDHMIFYSTEKNIILDQTEMFKAKLYTLDSIMDFKKQEMQIIPYRINNLLPPPEKPHIIDTPLDDFAQLHVFKNKRTLFLTEKFDPNQIQFILKADIVVISNESVDSLAILDQVVDFKEVILDNTNGSFYVNRLKTEAINQKTKLSSLHDHAYLVSISRNQKFLDMLF